MTAQQSKQIIAAARNVLAILPADTDSALAQLQAAIEACEKPKATVEKWIKPSKRPGYGYYRGWDRALESLDEYCERVRLGFVSRTGDGWWSDSAEDRRKFNTFQDGPKVDFAAQRERLSVCACGHRATKHHEDENANLLQCFASSCDCDHFHYQIYDKEEAHAA